MNINNCVKIFNCMASGDVVPIEELIELVSDFLTENNIENSDEMMKLVIQNPSLIQETIPAILDYYTRKYDICSIIYNNKIIFYYVAAKND